MKDYLILIIIALVALIVLQRGCGNFGERFRENQQQRQEQRKERKEERHQRFEDRKDDRRFMDGKRRFRDRERTGPFTK